MALIENGTESKGALIGNSVELKGTLGFKGARGYSAYEIAVQNGFFGTEQDWLATLGTSSHFSEDKLLYTTTKANENTLDLPSEYTSNSFIDIYVEGNRLDSSRYSINTSTRKITLTNTLPVVGTKVEIVCLTMSTNTLEISETVHAGATNKTSAGTKAVYDYVEKRASELETELPGTIISDNTTSTNKTYSSVKIVDMISVVNTDIDTKLDRDAIKVLTGSSGSIGAGETAIVDINYPTGFNKSNTLVISKMTSNNNVYYESLDLEPTTNGFPVIKNFALTDAGIRVWLFNTNTTTAKIGYYKIGILKG